MCSTFSLQTERKWTHEREHPQARSDHRRNGDAPAAVPHRQLPSQPKEGAQSRHAQDRKPDHQQVPDRHRTVHHPLRGGDVQGPVDSATTLGRLQPRRGPASAASVRARGQGRTQRTARRIHHLQGEDQGTQAPVKPASQAPADR